MCDAKFSIEVLGARSFDGYTQGETRNGWACPYFTFEQAQQIVKAHEESGHKAWCDEASDVFSFEVEPGRDLKEVDIFPAEGLNGKEFYPIGAFSWIWEEAGPIAA